jgi:8-oxo-dGTP diphosphatase
MRVWLAEVRAGVPEPLQDHDELRWVGLEGDALTELDWIPADFPIVDAVRRHAVR